MCDFQRISNPKGMVQCAMNCNPMNTRYSVAYDCISDVRLNYNNFKLNDMQSKNVKPYKRMPDINAWHIWVSCILLTRSVDIIKCKILYADQTWRYFYKQFNGFAAGVILISATGFVFYFDSTGVFWYIFNEYKAWKRYVCYFVPSLWKLF